ncbi:MAG: LacI family DNA-binding transcriptional regulator [Actinobacteria bacterium]|nr:LacI family DNA-binding transcriptional regulator [Actinomycetota bacterium]
MATSSGRRPLTGIREVAQLAGVSLGTVSNVINHPERVSEEMRVRVQAAIDRLGFVPNRNADLRSGQSRLLGLLLPDIRNTFFADLALGAVDFADDNESVVLLCDSRNDAAREARNLNVLDQQRVAGLLLSPVVHNLAPVLDLRRRRSGPIGVVLVDSAADENEFCSVSVNDIAGGSAALEHLLSIGAERPVLVNGPPSIRQCADRRRGARQALRRAGRAAASLTEITVPEMTVAGGIKAAEELIAGNRLPDAVFCANDLLAIGVNRRLSQHGVRIPEDVAIVGYDDIDRASDVPVPLSSVRQPTYRLGRVGCELLTAEINEGSEHRHRKVVFEPELVVRASSQRAGWRGAT